MNLKQKFTVKEIIHCALEQKTLCGNLATMLDDYLVGYSDGDRLEALRDLSNAAPAVKDTYLLHDFVDWLNEHIVELREIREAYDRECVEPGSKERIAEAMKTKSEEQVRHPLELHRAIEVNASKFKGLLGKYHNVKV